jgi:hypothetical protein
MVNDANNLHEAISIIKSYKKTYNYGDSLNGLFDMACCDGNLLLAQACITVAKTQDLGQILNNNSLGFPHALRNGHLEIAKLIWSQPLSDEQKDSLIHSQDDLAFRFSAEEGQIELVKWLLSIEKDKEKRSKMIHALDDQALRFAAAHGHLHIVKLLLNEVSCDKDREKMIYSLHGQALWWGAEGSHILIMRQLLKHAPNFFKDIPISKALLDPLVRSPNPIKVMELIFEHISSDTKLKELCESLLDHTPYPYKIFFQHPNKYFRKIYNLKKELDDPEYCERIVRFTKGISRFCRTSKNPIKQLIESSNLPPELIFLILRHITNEHILPDKHIIAICNLLTTKGSHQYTSSFLEKLKDIWESLSISCTPCYQILARSEKKVKFVERVLAETKKDTFHHIS